ncbi:MAG: hypothetical protein RLZ98_355 [Pseudomonadota bacterium]|jgi:small-conductance mechanosensitive channel
MEDFLTFLDPVLNKIRLFIANISDVWTLYQAVLVFAAFVVATLIAKRLTPPLEERLRRLEGQRTLLRILVVPLRRLRWILLALLLYAIASIMRDMTWPSRSYFVQFAANLTAAWAAISILSRVIRSRTLANGIAITAWAAFALWMVGYLDDIMVLLDGAALETGSVRISALAVLKAIIGTAVLIWLAGVAGEFFEGRLRGIGELSPVYQVLISKLIRAILVVLAILVAISLAGIDLTALTVFSGALGLGIGFGLQKTASNLISGFIILGDKSITPGDVISLGDKFGWIERLHARYVAVITRDGVEHLIPNETFITEPIVNWSHSNRQVRLEIKFGTSYGDDPHNVRRITVEHVLKLDRVLKMPEPVCHVTGFGDSSVDYVLRFWIADPENGVTNISGAAYLAVWDAFKANGVSIPFPHRHLVTDKDNPVRIAAAENQPLGR